jgi:hypothetical protein
MFIFATGCRQLISPGGPTGVQRALKQSDVGAQLANPPPVRLCHAAAAGSSRVEDEVTVTFHIIARAGKS